MIVRLVISDVDHIHSRFCILAPSPAIKDAEEINARVACYVGKWIVKNDVILKKGPVSGNSLCGTMTISVGRSGPEHVQYPMFLSPGRVFH